MTYSVHSRTCQQFHSHHPLYLSDFLWGGHWFGQILQLADNGLHGLHDAAPDLYRVGPFADGVKAFLGDGAGQNGGRGGAVSGLLVGVVGHVLNQLGADVLVFALEVDALGHGDAIFGDLGASPALLDDDCAALWGTTDKARTSSQNTDTALQ